MGIGRTVSIRSRFSGWPGKAPFGVFSELLGLARLADIRTLQLYNQPSSSPEVVPRAFFNNSAPDLPCLVPWKHGSYNI